MAGWKGYYVPGSVAYHRGFGTFGPALGRGGCDRLAIRNSLLFAWKNLSGHDGWRRTWLLAPARGSSTGCSGDEPISRWPVLGRRAARTRSAGSRRGPGRRAGIAGSSGRRRSFGGSGGEPDPATGTRGAALRRSRLAAVASLEGSDHARRRPMSVPAPQPGDRRPAARAARAARRRGRARADRARPPARPGDVARADRPADRRPRPR